MSHSAGFWPSALLPENVVAQGVSFADPDIKNGRCYWVEKRPPLGKGLIVSYGPEGYTEETSTDVFHVGTNAHGYGGGSFTASETKLYFFDNKSSSLVEKNLITGEFRFLTPPDPQTCYGDFYTQNGFLYALRTTKKQPFEECTLVKVTLSSSKIEVLQHGADFYANPRPSPCGRYLAWLQWDMPHMPWDECTLWVQKEGGSPLRLTPPLASAFQPTWQGEKLVFASDEYNGYWNLFQWEKQEIKPYLPLQEHEIGRPLWVLGCNTFGFLGKDKLLYAFCQQGQWKTGYAQGTVSNTVETDWPQIAALATEGNQALLIAGSATESWCILKCHTDNIEKPEVLRKSSSAHLLPQLSTPQFLDLGACHVIYYPPCGPYVLQTPPPLILKVHGGPTAQADTVLQMKVQYYTSRGFAYAEVNYRGSSGYGRAYRDALKGKWGIADVEDCIESAKALVAQGLGDAQHLFIIGNSAGGLTALNALIQFPGFFCGAVCHYAVSNLTSLGENIHKFEAHYEKNLLGSEGYLRSPHLRAHEIKTPLLLTHGQKDKVVPCSQSEQLARQMPHARLVSYPEEGHGYSPQTAVHVLEQELAFFQRLLKS